MALYLVLDGIKRFASAAAVLADIGAQKSLATIAETVTFNDRPIERYGIDPIVESGTSRVLSDADNGRVIEFTNNNPITLTFSTSLSSFFNVTIVQVGTGQVTWTGVAFLHDPDQLTHTKTKGVNSKVSFFRSKNSPNAFHVMGSTS